MTIDTRHKVWCNLGPLAAEPSSFADSFIQGSGGGVIMTKGTINLKGIYQLSPGQPVDIAYSDSENWIARVPRRLRVMNSFANPLNNVTSVLVGCKFAYLENRKPPVKNPTERELNEDDEEISDVERRARTVSVSARSVAAYILNSLGLTPASSIPFGIYRVVDTWDLSAGFVQELAKIAESECYRCFINMNEQVEFISLRGFSTGRGPVIDESKLIDLTPQTVGDLPADSVFARYESLALKPPKYDDDDPDNPQDPEELEKEREKRRQKRNWELDESYSVEQFIHSYTGDDGKEYEQRGTFSASTVTKSTYDAADRLSYRQSIKQELLGEVITETLPTYLLDAATASFLNEGGEYVAGPDKEDVSTVLQEYNRSIAPIGNIASTCGFEGSIDQLRNMGSIFSSDPGESGYTFSNAYVTSERVVFFEKNKYAGVTKTITRNYVPFMVTPFGSDEVSKMAQRLPPKIIQQQVNQAWFEGVQQLMFDAIQFVEYGSEVKIRTEREFGTESRPAQQERNKIADKKDNGTDPDGKTKPSPSVSQESRITWALGSSTSQTALELSPPYTSDDRIVGTNPNYSVVRSRAAQEAAMYASVENRLLLAHRAGAGFQLLPIDTPPKPFDLFCVRLNGCTAAYRVNGTTWTINPTGFVCTVEGLFWGAIDGTVNNAWFPLPPGAASLPAPVSVTTNASPAPANSIPMPTLFDPVNPDLTQLFTSLPTTTPPVYVVDAEPAHIIPPYHETIELTAGIQVGAGFNIQPWIPTALSLDAGVKVGGSIAAFNIVAVPTAVISAAANPPVFTTGTAIAVPPQAIVVSQLVPKFEISSLVAVPATVVQVAAFAPDGVGDASRIINVPAAAAQVAVFAPEKVGDISRIVNVPAVAIQLAALTPETVGDVSVAITVPLATVQVAAQPPLAVGISYPIMQVPFSFVAVAPRLPFLNIGGGAGSMASRGQVTTTLSIQANQTLTGFITLPRSCVIIDITTNQACWFRLYSNALAAAADVSRIRTASPALAAGVIADPVLPGAVTLNFEPAPVALNRETVSSVSSSYPYRITNDAGTGEVIITVTYLTLEA